MSDLHLRVLFYPFLDTVWPYKTKNIEHVKILGECSTHWPTTLVQETYVSIYHTDLVGKKFIGVGVNLEHCQNIQEFKAARCSLEESKQPAHPHNVKSYLGHF